MKKLLFIISLLFVAATSYSQIITLLDEDFTGTSIPTGWVQYEWGEGVGIEAWGFGSAVMPGDGAYTVNNFPNNAAIFDDDNAGSGSGRNRRSLHSPFMDANNSGEYALADIKLRYHYALNNKGSGGDNVYEDALRVWIMDNAGDAASIAIHTSSTDPVYHIIDIRDVLATYPDINSSYFKIVWEFDDIDGSWGWGAGIDDVYLHIQPNNDACENAIVIPSLPYTTTQNAIGSTNNGGFITACSGMNDGVWYTFTPSYSGEINISASFNILPYWDLEIGVYTGSCGSFTCIASADDGNSGDPEEINNLSVIAGTQYYINIGHYASSVNYTEHKFVLNINGNLSITENTIVGFEMYPNPVKDFINLSADDNINAVKIFNMLGQEVLQVKSNFTEVKIDTRNLVTGAYIAKVATNNQVGTYQFIKE